MGFLAGFGLKVGFGFLAGLGFLAGFVFLAAWGLQSGLLAGFVVLGDWWLWPGFGFSAGFGAFHIARLVVLPIGFASTLGSLYDCA